jgi:hypothetical protein
MACMGPSQEFAYQQAKAALTDITKLLKEKYFITTDVAYKENRWPVFANDQVINFMVLEDLLKDIFWTDACDGF